MDEVIDQPKLSVKDFAAKIKAKYPDYKDIPDDVLTDKIIAKYPDYASQVDVKKNSTQEQNQSTTPTEDISSPPVQDGSQEQPSGATRDIKSVSLDRQLPYLQQQASETFKDPMFANPNVRKAYKDKLAEPYSGRDYMKVQAALMQVDPYAKQEAQSGILEGINPLGETIPTAATAAVQGIKGGIEQLGKTEAIDAKEGMASGLLNVGVGLGKTALGVASAVVPELAAFNIASQGLEETNPQAAEWMSPTKKIIEDKYKEANIPVPKWKENAAAVADFVANLVVFGGAKYAEGKFTPKEVIDNSTPEERQKAEQKTEANFTPHPAEEKATAIDEDIKKNPDSPLAPVLKAESDNLHKSVADEQLGKAQDAATLTHLQDTKAELEKATNGLSDASKEVVQPAIDNIQQNIDAIKPQPDLTKSDKTENAQAEETTSQISPRQKQINNLVNQIADYNDMKNGRLGKKTSEGAKARNDIVIKAQELGLTIDEKQNGITLRNKNGKKVSAVNTDINNKGIKEDFVPLERRDLQTQEVFNKLNEVGSHAFPVIVGMDGKRMSERQIRTAMGDVVNDRPTNGAHELLTQLDEQAKNGTVILKHPDSGENIQVPINDFMQSIGKELEHIPHDTRNENTLSNDYDNWFNSLTDEQRATELEASKPASDHQAESETNVGDRTTSQNPPEPPAESGEPPSGTTGISIKAREQRAGTLGNEPAESGVGWTGEEALARGNELRAKGADPIAMINDESIPLHDKVAIAQSYANELGRETNAAGDKFGSNSKEYEVAKQKENDYLAKVKPLSTLAHKAFAAHQGEVDIDTGSWTGLVRAVEADGKKATPKQIAEAKELSGKVKTLTNQVEKLKQKLTDALNAAVEETPKNIKERAKEIANIIRQGKTSRPSVFSAASPASIVWDGALEVAAKTVEAGGTVAQAIADGLAHIKASDWYKNFDKKDEAESAFKNHFNEFTNDDILTKFVDKKDSKFTTQEVRDIWNYAKENYLDKDGIYENMLNGVSKDLGLTREQVRNAISQPKAVRAITDEMYRTQYKRNQAIGRAKEWVKTTNTPRLTKIFKAIPKFFFEKAIAGHGTVGMVTHAGTNIFRPSTWKSYWTDFGKQFRYMFKPSDYEMAKEDLQSRPNFILAKRSGLANDPNSIYDDYGGLKKFFGKFGTAGDRGFFALKVFRQDLFDNFYNKLSDVEKADPNTAKEIATLVNHSTGTSKVPIPETVGTAIFAPRLEASRWARLIGEPTKAVTTFTNWKNATPSEKAAAKIIAKGIGAMSATYIASLAVNQGLLSASGSDKKINFTHPLESDWMKHKIGDKTIDVTGGLVSSMHLLSVLISLPFLDKKELKGETQADKLYETTGKYLRGKLSPFASTGADVLTQHDFAGNTLPFSDAPPAHKYNHKMTWKEYLFSQAPIPVSEGARDVYTEMHDKGVSEPQIEDYFTGLWIGMVSGFTGTRIGVAPPVKNQSSRTTDRQETRTENRNR